MNHLTFLPNATVQISKESNYQGSAVLVKVKNAFYVLTSAHVTFGERCEQYTEELSSLLTYKSEKFGNLTFIRELGNFEIYKAHDIVAIEVGVNSDDFPEVFFTNETDEPTLEFIFRGRGKVQSGKIYSVMPCYKNGTAGADIHIEIPEKDYTDFQGEAGAEVLQGLSGSGVFIHDNDSSEAFLTSIVKSVSEDNFVGVNCTCISLFNKYLIPELNLIDYKHHGSEKSTSSQSKLIDSATQIDVEELTRSISQNLISQFMPSSLGNSNIAVSHTSPLSSIESVPLPRAIASRNKLIDSTVYSLKNNNTAWLYGAAGVGKTVAAKMAAKHLGGRWIGANLRGLNSQEVCQILASSLLNLNNQEVTGILIDDLECVFTPTVTEKLLSLHHFCKKINVFILFTSSKVSDEDYLYSADLPQEVEQKVDDFSEVDIKEILSALGVTEDYWARYIYMSSGGGHPQLVIAMIQSMKKSKWSIEEFRTLNSLLQRNETVEKVKKKTRERLLHELPASARKIVERVSLITGRFDRNLVLDLALLSPKIADAGITFDSLVGSWIDQHEIDRFSLSPLLSNFAAATLTKQQRKPIQCEIADSILRTKVIDPITMNTAFIAAFAGENTGALALLCYPILTTELSELQIIAPHLIMFTFLNTDNSIYAHDSNVNIMLRGAQLILLTCFEDKKGSYLETFNRFEIEADNSDTQETGSSVLVRIMIYSKLLLSQPKFGNLPNWNSIVTKLNTLFENKAELLPISIPHKEIPTKVDGISAVSFLIINQINQIDTIGALIPLFEFINNCEEKIKNELFSTIEQLDLGLDIIVRGAWLSEFNKGTINCEKHTVIFSELETIANNWGNNDLAEICVKFSAVIWDETGGRSDKAIELIDIGLAKYGCTSFCLLRAKALVLYREKNYKESLILSKKVLAGKVEFKGAEKAYFYREAAICAENESDFSLASEYFLLGSASINVLELPEMLPMKIGLQADSALACWHDGDKKESIQRLADVLDELKKIDPKSSLNAAHCHVFVHHILLWLEQESKQQTILLAGGQDTQIYSGIVSNPEPNKDISKQKIAPLDFAQYILASIESYCVLDVGISSKLTKNLTNGPLVEGESHFTFSKLDIAIIKSNEKLLISALKSFVAYLIYASGQVGTQKNSTDIAFTYQTLSEATVEDFDHYSSVVEHYILSFVISCALQNKWEEVDKLIECISIDPEVAIRADLTGILKGSNVNTTDVIAYNTKLIMGFRHHQNQSPINLIIGIFSLTLTAIQIGIDIKQSNLISRLAFESLKVKWLAFWGQQRYLLKYHEHHFVNINKALSVKGYSWPENVLCLMKAILPTLDVGDELDVNRTLDELLLKVRTKK
ncbi:hypothetical protein [Colwellia psychrerythraea]|uniref:Uncharacterized protein n=1 Tax=Colwellia psychrerythraea TaxID=28229 RepID=A0A099KH79_COLPS|nr:hypothetical protein [Colwellia psychrerythraea]KGJ90124.1 hypothetical protein ND2E_3680 [Colwellia psychrerythraea]